MKALDAVTPIRTAKRRHRPFLLCSMSVPEYSKLEVYLNQRCLYDVYVGPNFVFFPYLRLLSMHSTCSLVAVA